MIEQKQRLDTYVQQSFSLSRSQAKEAILAGFVRVNGYVQKPAYLVVEEDDVALDLEQVSAMNKATNVPVKKESMSIVFLYEDDHVLVVNKPVGMVVHEGDHAGEDTMIDCLQQRSVRLFDSGQANRPGVVHRLDRMTEGVMVFAKSEQAYMALTDQFRERRIEKQYWAILEGNLDNDELVVDQPIARHGRVRNKYTVKADGKAAKTVFRVMKRYNSQTLCLVQLFTGRTHQIRVHAQFIGHPIIGDALYSDTARKSGQLLQACVLGFMHPVTQQFLKFSVPRSKRFGVKHV